VILLREGAEAGWTNAIGGYGADLGKRLAPEYDRLAPAARLALGAPEPLATTGARLEYPVGRLLARLNHNCRPEEVSFG
jgi:hypothetical protein